MKIHVTSVIMSPNENILRPLLRYFLNNPLLRGIHQLSLILELLRVNETPIRNMKVNAVTRAKYHKNPELTSKGYTPKKCDIKKEMIGYHCDDVDHGVNPLPKTFFQVDFHIVTLQFKFYNILNFFFTITN